MNKVTDNASSSDLSDSAEEKALSNQRPQSTQQREIGGRKGLEPTRYGDWEKAGRCIDF